MKRKALITGVTGQDGAYLARLLLDKDYEVWGTYRRTSTLNVWRLDELDATSQVSLVCMELTDPSSINDVIRRFQPDEVYNLAAQSFVPTSFQQPLYTGELDGLSVTRLLDSLRLLAPHARFYQASTSEMFGKVQSVPQSEKTPFYPRSPYGVAKLYGHWITVNYRESYDLFACSGILFNHESPLRGLEFVTRKITTGFADVRLGHRDHLELGNLDAKRDWGFAGDYVEGMWRMLQADKADDYVLATGVTSSIRKFAELTANALGFELEWHGNGENEVGIDRKTGKAWVRVNPEYYRPAEVDLLLGDSSKARALLSWSPRVGLEELVQRMAEADLRRREATTKGRTIV
jgi:GDPmannose 4,6-dehydratase